MSELHIYIHLPKEADETSPKETHHYHNLDTTADAVEHYFSSMAASGVTITIKGECADTECQQMDRHTHKVFPSSVKEPKFRDPDPVHNAGGEQCPLDDCHCRCEHQHNSKLLDHDKSRLVKWRHVSCPLHPERVEFDCDFGCHRNHVFSACPTHGNRVTER